MRLSRLCKLLFAGSAMAAGASAAQAAQPPHDWTGVYLGLNAGQARGEAKADFSAVSSFENATDFKSDWKGGYVGAQLGYNYQTGSWVFGAEGDIDYLGRKFNDDANYGFAPFLTHDRFDHEIQWFGTARARAGFDAGKNLLLYGTGGLAFGDVKSAYLHDDIGYSTESGAVHKTKLGWSAGAGAELALNEKWSAKAEYLHVDLGNSDLQTFDGGTLEGTVNVKDKFDTVRVGLNYKF